MLGKPKPPQDRIQTGQTFIATRLNEILPSGLRDPKQGHLLRYPDNELFEAGRRANEIADTFRQMADIAKGAGDDRHVQFRMQRTVWIKFAERAIEARKSRGDTRTVKKPQLITL